MCACVVWTCSLAHLRASWNDSVRFPCIQQGAKPLPGAGGVTSLLALGGVVVCCCCRFCRSGLLQQMQQVCGRVVKSCCGVAYVS